MLLWHHGILVTCSWGNWTWCVSEDKATKTFCLWTRSKQYAVLKQLEFIMEDIQFYSPEFKIAEPVGTAVSLQQQTHQQLFQSLIALKRCNPICFAFHPSAQESSVHAAQTFVMQRLQLVLLKTVPNGLQNHQWKQLSTYEPTKALRLSPSQLAVMPWLKLLTIKPALGVGAGNVPAYVENYWPPSLPGTRYV